MFPADWANSIPFIRVTRVIAEPGVIFFVICTPWGLSRTPPIGSLGAGDSRVHEVIWTTSPDVGLAAEDTVIVQITAALPADRTLAIVAFCTFLIAESGLVFISVATLSDWSSGTTAS